MTRRRRRAVTRGIGLLRARAVDRPVIYRLDERRTSMTMPNLVKTGAAAVAASLLDAITTDPGSVWYDQLNKPSWQPPPSAFALVRPPIYALIAIGGARVLDRTSGPERRAFLRAYTLNLVLNAAWTPLLFRVKAPVAALADVVTLNVLNAHLLRGPGALTDRRRSASFPTRRGPTPRRRSTPPSCTETRGDVGDLVATISTAYGALLFASSLASHPRVRVAHCPHALRGCP